MRLKQNRLSEYQHRKAILRKDAEGSSYTEYGSAVPIMAEMWAAGGKKQTEMYGNRLPNIRNLRLQGEFKEIPGENGKVCYQTDQGPIITVGDGICLYAGNGERNPDYQVIAIYPYWHLTLEVEKL